jgi:hypothetical protein
MNVRRDRDGLRSGPARSDAALVLLILAAGFSLLGAWRFGNRSAGVDFYQFWAAGLAVRSMEVGNIYSQAERVRIGAEFLRRAEAKPGAERERAVAEHRKVLPTYHSPLLYTVMGLLSSGDYETDFGRYRHACLVLTLASSLVLCSLLGYSALQTLAFLVVLLAWFEPLYSDLRVGNVSQLQLVTIVLFLWNQSRSASTPRDLLGGLLLGVSILFKPSVVLVVGVMGLSWLLARDFRKVRDQCLGMAIGAGFGLLAAGAYFGTLGVWLDFVAILPIPSEIVPFSEGNYAPAAQILELSGVQIAPYLSLLLLGVTAGLLWRRIEAVRGSRPHDFAVAALGCQFFLLASPVAWVHYYLLCLPACLLALRAEGVGSRALARRLLAGVALVPLVRSPVTQQLWNAYPHTYAVGVSLAMLILFALVLCQLGPRETESA